MRSTAPGEVGGSAISLPSQIEDADCRQHRFPLSRLSTLRLGTEDSGQIHFPSILQLPSVRTLSADSFSPSDRAWSIGGGVSGIHNLELTRCMMGEDDVLPLLRACGQLRMFTFHWNQPWSDWEAVYEEWDEGINIASWIMEGLPQSRNTLEVLYLQGQSPFRRDPMSLGSLTAFPRLHSLCVPAVMVLNSNMSPPQRTLQLLPNSLKDLNLIIAGVPEEEILESELLECLRHEERYPALAVVTITWHRYYMLDDMPRFPSLERACGDRGIALAFESIP